VGENLALSEPSATASLTTPLFALDDTILELLPAAVYVCDAQGVIVRYNKKAAELWGRSPRIGDTEARFCGSHRLFYPDGRSLPHDATPMVDVLRTGVAARDLEVIVEQPSGRRIWALVNIEPLFDASGEVAGAVNCFQDITARKDDEKRLRESQELLRGIIETTPECVKLVGADGALIHMNSAGLRMIEAEMDVLGSCTFDLIAPEHRDLWTANHQRVCRGEKVTWEFDILGLQGTRRHMETHAAPLQLPDGSVAQLAVTRDITERKRAEAALRDRERHLAELLEALPAAVYTTDAAGRITFYNDAAVTLWGCRPELGKSEWCGSWRLYWPDGKPMPHEECPMAIALKEDRPIRGETAIAERPDGTRIPFLACPTPLHDASGKLVGAVNMLVDITAQKEAEEQQRLLINELNHRVKNTLATVQSIAAQSFRGEAETPAQSRFEDRLMALSKVHDVLTQENWEGAGIHAIVALTIAPLCGADDSRFDVSGEEVRLTPRMALPLSMALHELCTNAVKYGALSNGSGRIAIGWRTEGAGHGRSLLLRWEEHGGPPVKAPGRQGFGSRLIERGLARELDAQVQLEYRPSGLVCEIRAPLLDLPAVPKASVVAE